jgi:hypothetical protein
MSKRGRVTKKNKAVREALANAYSEMVGKDISPVLAYRMLAVTVAVLVESCLQAENNIVKVMGIGRFLIKKIQHKQVPSGYNRYKEMGTPYMPVFRFYPCDSIKNYIVKKVFNQE